MHGNLCNNIFHYSFLISILFAFNNAPSQNNAVNNIIKLRDGWKLQSSEKINANGKQISSWKYSADNWFNTVVPSTVLGTLVKNNVYKDVFVGANLESIPKEQFNKAWWYRTEFKLSPRKNKHVSIQFDGIIYRANVWFNGRQIGNSDEIFGVYRRFEFDVSSLIKFGEKNVLAVEVIPPVKGEPSVGFVDWNPTPPDNNMGIWREVTVKISGDASINFPFVISKIDLENFKTAELTISNEIKNNTEKKISGIIYGEIGSVKFSKNIKLEPNENKLVTFTPSEFSQLKFSNPRIWWIHSWGEPELYDLKLELKINGKISDASETLFGIREIFDYINEQGHRGYKLNGRKLLITGGGWVDDLFLEHDYKKLEAQVRYVKHMGLNTIRLEGIWGNNEDLFDLCDKYGILLMVGWSCQWEWEGYIGKPADEFGAIKTPEDIKLISLSWKDQIKWLRNHPSIFVWAGASDKLPRPELEKEFLRILEEEDPSRPYLASTKQGESMRSGFSAVKMNGPYEYVPPMYWATDTKNGGAFGFNTETGPGPQVPPLESIKKMIPTNHRWPIDSMWFYHCGRHEFNNLEVYNNAMDNRLGKPTNLMNYLVKAQYLNYEGMRAMFEAFTANRPLTTGIIQWMLNAAWPKVWWQLYDYYLMPNGAFYGAKKALEPLHIQYDFKDHAVYVVNNTLENYDYLKARVGIFNCDIFTTPKFEKEEYLSLKSMESKKLFTLPKWKDLDGLTDTYFLLLKLYNPSQDVISNNFYCLSAKQDVLDYEKNKWYVTPISEYADLTELDKLGKIDLHLANESQAKHKLNVSYKISHENDRERVDIEFINKTGSIALQIEMALTKGKEGEPILPIFWDDNYFSIMPSERRVISGYFFKDDTQGIEPYLQVNGWNLNPEE